MVTGSEDLLLACRSRGPVRKIKVAPASDLELISSCRGSKEEKVPVSGFWKNWNYESVGGSR
jgi:hypothetical protein